MNNEENWIKKEFKLYLYIMEDKLKINENMTNEHSLYENVNTVYNLEELKKK